VSRQYATLLLDTALQYSKWELAKDLVRFLRAIGMFIPRKSYSRVLWRRHTHGNISSRPFNLFKNHARLVYKLNILKKNVISKSN
jgi:hypothetical protein